jgi:hypothetical protein
MARQVIKTDFFERQTLQQQTRQLRRFRGVAGDGNCQIDSGTKRVFQVNRRKGSCISTPQRQQHNNMRPSFSDG